jgi:hypothetical protein
MRALVTIMLCSTLAPSVGCSLGIQGPPPNLPVSEAPRCDTGQGGVFADGVIAVSAGVGGIAVMGESTGAGLALLALGGLTALTARSGYRNATACEQAHTAHALWVAAERRERAAPPEPAPSVAAARIPTPAVAAAAVAAGAAEEPKDPYEGENVEPTSSGSGSDTRSRPQAATAWDDFWELAP